MAARCAYSTTWKAIKLSLHLCNICCNLLKITSSLPLNSSAPYTDADLNASCIHLNTRSCMHPGLSWTNNYACNTQMFAENHGITFTKLAVTIWLAYSVGSCNQCRSLGQEESRSANLKNLKLCWMWVNSCGTSGGNFSDRSCWSWLEKMTILVVSTWLDTWTFE